VAHRPVLASFNASARVLQDDPLNLSGGGSIRETQAPRSAASVIRPNLDPSWQATTDLFAMRCPRESTGTFIDPSFASTRSIHAAEKSTPSMLVMTSIRTGGTTIWKHMTVSSQRVGADDNVLNAARVERG
jgi:hypothetical protein